LPPSNNNKLSRPVSVFDILLTYQHSLEVNRYGSKSKEISKTKN
jgi:hypothetical protein